MAGYYYKVHYITTKADGYTVDEFPEAGTFSTDTEAEEYITKHGTDIDEFEV